MSLERFIELWNLTRSTEMYERRLKEKIRFYNELQSFVWEKRNEQRERKEQK